MAFKSLSKSEKAYIQASLQSNSSLRGDGRSLQEYRTISLETGVAPLANGSARLNIGKNDAEAGGGTEILAAVKLEVEDIEHGERVDQGRVTCSVSCSPAAYPLASSGGLDDLQHDYSTFLDDILSHPSITPANLGIVRGKKAWLLALDLVVLSDSGNVYDAMFMAARAAIWDTKVPRTRSVEYRAQKKQEGDMDVDEEKQSGLDTRQVKAATDFELEDYWDEGIPLVGREAWPICVTLNLLSSLHFLDATSQEEAATPLRLLLVYSVASKSTPALQGMQLLGSGEVDVAQIKKLIQDGEKHASQLLAAINLKLRDEEVRLTDKARLKFASVR
ncbi:ribosomal protein S5 domain 2-like protein [Auriscalpium vulgare]|uniref:Ribosomal protein S5 domain 2-like protein n=1 Tax=Auriscalpium vulgare TaxID=40419 RepID=A0ACB8S7I4_9AGAM|nr:ribosomal protein S5 domain 2-like protein [Auriscalpium vulgare]